jgi:hypothetical protein
MGSSDAAHEKAIAELSQVVRGGAAIALVGAGSSKRVGYPLWGELLAKMAGEILQAHPHSRDELAAIASGNDAAWQAEEYRRLLGDDGYAALIRETFGPERAPFDDFHRDLVRVPFRHVFTTNYDAVLESAHVEAFHAPAIRVEWKQALDVQDLLVRLHDPLYERRYVYLHGRFNDPEAIVLTERDYTERYARSADTWPKLFAVLATARIVSIGFSLSDFDVMALFRGTKASLGPGRPRHFAILPASDREDSAAARRRLQGKYGIEPVFYPWTPDHAGLHDLVRMLLPAVGSEAAAPEPQPGGARQDLRKALDPAPPAELKERILRGMSGNELKMFIAEAFPEIRGGLEGIVSTSHPLSYQAFEVVQYFARRGELGRLGAKLSEALGPGDAKG